jgi:flavodoxin I
MKILIVYNTNTGNTEKIANAILREIEAYHDVDIARIKDAKIKGIGDYDLIFVGSPIHAGGLSTAAQEFLNDIADSPNFKLAGFVTHASPAYEKEEGFEKGINTFSDVAKEKRIEYLGCFDCQGRLDPNIQPMVQQGKKISDEEWSESMKVLDGHPNEEDERAAADFAKEIVSKI